MIKRFIPLALAFSLTWPGLAQLGHAQTYLPDTIRVNKLATTYLIFPSKITLVDISPEYLVKIESGNIVFVRPRLTTARMTPIFIRTENSTYLGYLTVSGKTPPAFVEISKLLNPPSKAATAGTAVAMQQGTTITPASKTPGTTPYSGPLLASINPLTVITSPIDEYPVNSKTPVTSAKNGLQVRMDSLLNGFSTHNDRGHNSGISIKLTHLVHDSTNTFVQLTLTNKTAMPFLLDQVSFWYQHQAKKRRGAYLDGETYPMEPVYEIVPERVEAGQQTKLRFVLPQFAPQSHSRFVINVREKTGTRNVTLSLPMRSVLYAHARPKNVVAVPKNGIPRPHPGKNQIPSLTWTPDERKQKS